MPEQKSPAFQFYVKDWRSSTRVGRMSFKERGMYLELLIEQWDKGPLPLDVRALADAIGAKDTDFAKCWPTIRPCFLHTPDGWLNERLERERLKQQLRKQRSADWGKDGAEAKWGARSESATGTSTRSQRLSEARRKGTHTEEEWQEMLRRCGNRCVKCGVSADDVQGGRLNKDHIVPIYLGGDDSIQNLQPLCRGCNSAKGPDSTDLRPFAMPAKRLASVSETPSLGNGTPGFSLSIATAGAIASASASAVPPVASKTAIVDDEIATRGGWLVERYGELYSQHRRGAHYRQRPNLDWMDACDLCRHWDNTRLEKLATVVLTTDEPWIASTDRSFKIFAMKATWADDRLTAAEQGTR